MSLTSYRAAPPRGNGLSAVTVERERRDAGLAATYSSAPWGAVPSALRVFTAEFGMGSGVLPLAMTTRPSKDQGPGIRDQGSEEKGCLHAGLVAACDGFFIRRPSSDVRRLNTIKPIERLVPVGTCIAALAPPAYRRDGLSRLLGETWF